MRQEIYDRVTEFIDCISTLHVLHNGCQSISPVKLYVKLAKQSKFSWNHNRSTTIQIGSHQIKRDVKCWLA